MSDSLNTILLIEDNPGDARLIELMLAEDPESPFRVSCVDRLSRGLEFLASEKPGLVLLDLSLPDSQGLDTFDKVYAHSPTVPIIVLTGNDDHVIALSAVKTGAQDYLIKGKLDRELLVRSIAVVFIDLDHFKFINDSLGHNAGDVLLQKMAERLRQAVRDGDTVARMGGDEFILVLDDQHNEDVVFRAMQRIVAKINEPITIDGRELFVTCSAGISLHPQDGTDV